LYNKEVPRKNLPKLFAAPPLCQGKHRYATRAEAERVGLEQELLNFGEDLSLHAYQCTICRGWHLTRHQK